MKAVGRWGILNNTTPVLIIPLLSFWKNLMGRQKHRQHPLAAGLPGRFLTRRFFQNGREFLFFTFPMQYPANAFFTDGKPNHSFN